MYEKNVYNVFLNFNILISLQFLIRNSANLFKIHFNHFLQFSIISLYVYIGNS